MKKLLCALSATAALYTVPALAGHEHHDHNHHHQHGVDANAPISIMGDHMHAKGEWMLSYKFMSMGMRGNRDGTNELSPTQISGVTPNRFFGLPMQPNTLRIVPTEMTMDMHMFGAMYAPSDRLTLMLMVPYLDNEMDQITFAAASPTTQLGTFTTKTNGIGDIKLSGLFKLLEKPGHQILASTGLSLPTGSIDEEATILSPMNTRLRVRVPYMMQLGTGTYDFLPRITYSGRQDKWGWGAQLNSEFRLGRNAQGYTRGDRHQFNSWASYAWKENLSSSLRLSGQYEGQIDGIDDQIFGPVQTANPEFYGGKYAEIGFGLKYKPRFQTHSGHTFGAEIALPIYQNLNGPQMERDYTLTATYRKSF